MAMIEKIISGGQTGVDRAALDAAIAVNIPHGGFCPKGRRAEDGAIPKKYNLSETESAAYSIRTKLNISESDGTLILISNFPVDYSSGTLLTIREINLQKKPNLLLNLLESDSKNLITAEKWIKENNIVILNIAGPRESQSTGIYDLSFTFLQALLQRFIRLRRKPQA